MPAARSLRAPQPIDLDNVSDLDRANDLRAGLHLVPDAHAPAPFLKWVGGKGRLLRQLDALIPQGRLRYGEPFLGGGAVFFHLRAQGRLERAVLCDYSRDIVGACEALRDDPDTLLALLRAHETTYLAADADGRAAYFQAVRERHPVDLTGDQAMTTPERAARMLFLNRTCFNGLWRENSRGRFNVPHGRYPNPGIVQEDKLRAAAKALRHAEILQADFRRLPELAAQHRLDFVYLDPPYHPVSATSSFNAYSGGTFPASAQADLAGVCRKLDAMGVRWLLSNSDCGLIRDLYADFAIHPILAPRSVNCKGDKRGDVAEVAVCNYDVAAAVPVRRMA